GVHDIGAFAIVESPPEGDPLARFYEIIPDEEGCDLPRIRDHPVPAHKIGKEPLPRLLAEENPAADTSLVAEFRALERREGGSEKKPLAVTAGAFQPDRHAGTDL